MTDQKSSYGSSLAVAKPSGAAVEAKQATPTTDERFWARLASKLDAWVFVYSRQKQLETFVKGRRFDEAGFKQIMALSERFSAARDRSFVDVMEMCAKHIESQPAAYTFANLETELRKRNLPLYISARSAVVPDHHTRLLLRKQSMPFEAQFIVTTDEQYLAKERQKASQSCAADLTAEQKSRAAEIGPAAFNVELLSQAGMMVRKHGAPPPTMSSLVSRSPTQTSLRSKPTQ